VPILDIINTNSSKIIFYQTEKFKIEDLLISKLPISDIEIINNTIGTPRKTERFGARLAALNILKSSYKGISYLKNGRPYLIDSTKYISISHTKDIICLLISDTQKIGIDIQYQSKKITNVAKRVFNDRELTWANNELDKLTQLWCIKETVYKASQIQGLSFIKDISITPQAKSFSVRILSGKVIKLYTVETTKFNEYCVAYML
jgi:4'-phosphopantetheinyl transferase